MTEISMQHNHTKIVENYSLVKQFYYLIFSHILLELHCRPMTCNIYKEWYKIKLESIKVNRHINHEDETKIPLRWAFFLNCSLWIRICAPFSMFCRKVLWKILWWWTQMSFFFLQLPFKLLKCYLWRIQIACQCIYLCSTQ